MTEQNNSTGSLFSKTVKTKHHIYYFDVKQAKNGTQYMTIIDSWRQGEQTFRGCVTLFSEHLTEFSQAFEQVKQQLN